MAAVAHFGRTLCRAFLHAVPQVQKATPSSEGRGHGAGGKGGQGRVDLRVAQLMLLLPVELNGVLPLERVQVGEGFLQVELLLGSVRGLRVELLPGVMRGHRPGGDS